MKATSIILAGGKSSRMGTNKALLTIDGETVIEKIAKALKSITTEMIVVTNSPAQFRFLEEELVTDRFKESGPLAGIEAGLNASSTEKNLIVACDMPFISPRLGECLLKQLDSYDAAVPKIDDHLHPLFAAYRREIREEAELALRANELKIKWFLEKINTRILNENELQQLGFSNEDFALYNMNHPHEFAKARELSSQKDDGRG
ncbi:molybdenum cofactor guanylyltransferase [Cytobacillus purgationiresistens]|uniref:Probable molybdenum cofactor guanylyltransferase n=1 Tax=Cytobacillus purgationiresistens TaxID=863449 RepID=A0ABU0AN32_9BACI|nr:molybdenum cofactor guanylyltransferase [Cytobacillus purgationiresistens]MDQ0271803.1 molybdopterin-guanine dinucleotide biosynthesis protein A [Cytobacillus purgationiresistens]